MLKKNYRLVTLLGILLLINMLASQYYLRFDITHDQRYTLKKATKTIVNPVSYTHLTLPTIYSV